MYYTKITKKEAKIALKNGGTVYAVKNFLNNPTLGVIEVVPIHSYDRLDDYTRTELKSEGFIICGGYR